MDNHIDLETWIAVQQGDREAFERLYTKTVLQLTNHTYKIIKDEDLVKDILQEVYVSLYTKRNSLPSDLNVIGYLQNAVKYKVSTILRDRLSRETHHVHLLRQTQLMEASQPAPYEATELSSQIKAGINLLPEKCREAFILSHFDELNYKAVAERMGISVKTVEKHVSKALHILRNELREESSIYLMVVIAAGFCFC